MTNKKPKFIVLNWKMNPSSLKEAISILNIIKNYQSKIKNHKIIIAAPSLYLPLAAAYFFRSKIELASQNIFWEKKGAYTGEISPLMLKNLGIKYVLVGHSERRQYLRETDEMIVNKLKAATENKLIPILCVGETLQIRKKGIAAVQSFLKKQIQRELKQFIRIQSKLKLIVAYEPIWAIGTGKNCSSQNALETIKFIRKILTAKPYSLNPYILYGGSVNKKNIDDYLNLSEIDGVLVGGASVEKKELKDILKILK